MTIRFKAAHRVWAAGQVPATAMSNDDSAASAANRQRQCHTDGLPLA